MFDIFYINHGNPEADVNFKKLQENLPHICKTRFFGNYLKTLHRLSQKTCTKYFWAVSSICDYKDFDFKWEPVPWEDKQLHVFCTEGQKFGDTFFVNRNKLNHQLFSKILKRTVYAPSDPNNITLERLEYYKDVNWHTEFNIKRVKYPTVYYGSNITALETIKKYNPKGHMYFWCIDESAKIIHKPECNPTLWEKPKLHVFEQEGGVLLVPRDAKQTVSKQLYDYDNILRHNQHISTPKPQDIVFISNGEKNADSNLQLLRKWGKKTCFHVDGINGRSAAYKAAAKKSTTPWFFAVFAKCEVVPEFNFSFQPDVLREPCHYIFHAKNPLNGLEYGHQAVILYNKKLVLSTDDPGLDFTLSMPHTVIPELSCIARYNTDEFSTWRTAFREVIKLKADNTIESQARLNTWLTIADGNFAEWSIKGSVDGVEYFEKVKGEHDKLMLSFEWIWLKEYFNSLQ